MKFIRSFLLLALISFVLLAWVIPVMAAPSPLDGYFIATAKVVPLHGETATHSPALIAASDAAPASLFVVERHPCQSSSTKLTAYHNATVGGYAFDAVPAGIICSLQPIAVDGRHTTNKEKVLWACDKCRCAHHTQFG